MTEQQIAAEVQANIEVQAETEAQQEKKEKPPIDIPPHTMLLTYSQAALILGIAKSTFLAHVKSGRLPQSIKIGGSTRWNRELIEQVARGEYVN